MAAPGAIEAAAKTEAPREARALLTQSGLVIAGLALLVAGANLFVRGSVDIARILGVSELVIGLTIVAAGTSLPEVATSIMAAIRGERDIAIGNVVGSNLFNILGVCGLAALVRPFAVAPAAIGFDLPVMVAVAAACFPIFYTTLLIKRWEGALFLFYYLAYTTYLVLVAAGHSALFAYSRLMLVFVPLTALALVVTMWQEWRKG